MKHPFILSFPRSGLHLTSKIIGWDLFVDFKLMHEEKQIVNKIKENKKEILFTHKTTKMLSINCINFILCETKPILIIRDPRDALSSWYHLYIKNTNAVQSTENLREFLEQPFCIKGDAVSKSKISLWRDHVRGYKKYENKIHTIIYENLINNYEKECKKLSEYLGFEVKKEMPTLEQVEMSRKGIIGDHKNLLKNDMIEKINSECEQEIKYINSLLY
jgi:hypothetical protein